MSLSRHFFPFLLFVGFRYMGAFAGMAVSLESGRDMRDKADEKHSVRFERHVSPGEELQLHSQKHTPLAGLQK